MKLWKISQTKRVGFDTYDSAVVCANTAEEAANLHPSGDQTCWDEGWGDWPDHAGHVKVEYLGIAICDSPCVIVASYNAG